MLVSSQRWRAQFFFYIFSPFAALFFLLFVIEKYSTDTDTHTGMDTPTMNTRMHNLPL
jgi:hypothetical protein